MQFVVSFKMVTFFMSNIHNILLQRQFLTKPEMIEWSITLYDFETRSQLQNKTNNAALSSYDDLRFNADGSVDLYFGPKAPRGFENNWIETISNRGWWVWFRFYSPSEGFFDKSWQLKDFEKVGP